MGNPVPLAKPKLELLHDDDEIRRGTGLQSRPAAPAGAPALRRPTAVSCRPGGIGDLFHAPHRLTEDCDGSTAPLPTAKTYPPMVGDGSSTHPRHHHKSAEKPRHSCRGWIGVGRAGLNAQEP